MATFTVSTSQNYTSINGGSFADYDRITINSGATVTFNTDTNIIERLTCVTLGKARIENTSTTTPIIIKTGSNEAGFAQLRFEAGGIAEIQGAWIELGTSDGTSGQTFTLPQNTNSESLGDIPCVFVFDSGATDPVIYNRAPSLTDSFGDDKLGTLFTQSGDVITFGDGTEGYIPPNGASIRIPNIVFQDHSTSSFTDWDFATSGKCAFDKVLFNDNFASDFSGGSSIDLRNIGFGYAPQDMSFSATESVTIAHMGALYQANSHLLNLSGVNDPVLDNVFIYNVDSTTQYHGIYPVHASGGTFTNCRVLAPNQPASTSRAGLYITNGGVTVRNFYYGGAGVGINFGSAASNAVVEDCGISAAGKRNPSVVADIALLGVNSSNNLIQRFNNYPATVAEGLVSHDTYFFSVSTGTSNYTVNDCDIYAGQVGDANRNTNPIFSNGANHRFNNIRVTGDHSGHVVNHSTASSGTQITNLIAQNAMTNTNDFEWVNGVYYENAYTSDQLDNAPATSGTDVGTLHLIRDNTTDGYLYKPMGAHPTSGLLEEENITGSYFFNNAGSLYMDTSGDQLVFIGSVHGGITDFTAYTLKGSGTGNFSTEFAMRNPGGTWSTWTASSTANLSSELAALPGYDSDVGLQMKFRVTRGASNLTQYLSSIRLGTTFDRSYVAPFEVFPTKATFKGITVGDVVYIQDATDTLKLFTTATSADDIELTLPNANNGETWTYVVKRAGYAHQRGTITITSGTDVTVNVSLPEKQQATGGSMYTGSTPVSVTTDFDFVAPQFSIDISAADTPAQNVFDATENALITQDGMKWLAKYNYDTSYVNLGGAGSFLFHQNNIRVRRAAPANENAGISAYIFSTQSAPVDEVNGTVNLFSGTIVSDFLEADFDDGDGVDVTVGQFMSKLNSMIEQSGADYRYKTTAIDKTGYTLTSGERAAIATAVEAAIINEGDGQQVIDAIVQAIGNENVTAATIAAAVWSYDMSSHNVAGSVGNQANFNNKVIGWLRSLL